MRAGLRLYCDKTVKDNVKEVCKHFCKWLRRNYSFPIRVNVYLRDRKCLKDDENNEVSGIFFDYADKFEEPYISIAAGDYEEWLEECGDRDSALAAYLGSMAHELTHYFQWLQRPDFEVASEEVLEKEADEYREYILEKYAAGTEHLY